MKITVNSMNVVPCYGGQRTTVEADVIINGEVYQCVYKREEPSGRVSVESVNIPSNTTENTLTEVVVRDMIQDWFDDY